MTIAMNREGARLQFAICVLMIQQTSRKHYRVPEYIVRDVDDRLSDCWDYLTVSEKMSMNFMLEQRSYFDTKIKGPSWKAMVPAALLHSKMEDLAAEFIVCEHKRQN